MLYTTLSSLKSRLWITNSDSDSELSLIIERATNIIKSEIGDISEKNITERVDSHWNNKLYLKNIPNLIKTIKKVSWERLSLYFFDWYIIYLKKPIPRGNKWVLVEYTAWFTEIPTDIEEICLDLSTIFVAESNLNINTEKLVDKNIKTKKLWDLMITYFWENEKSFSSKDILSPTKKITEVFKKYKSFNWLAY